MLSWRHHWVERTQAYETHMAQLQRETETAVLRDKAADWAKRQHELREEEWKLHHDCIEAARVALHRFQQRRSKTANLSDIARLIELASRLGRLATGLPTDKTELTGTENGPIRLHLDFEAMLQKVYGQPLDIEASGSATVPVPPAELPPPPSASS